MRRILAFVVAVGIAGHASAAETPAVCPAMPAPVPAEFTGWREAAPLVAAKTAAAAQRTAVRIGEARRLALSPGADVRFAAPPGRPDPGSGKAGLVSFTIATAGTYRVALSAGAWVEVVHGGKPVTSTGHGHGPDCSGIRKIVDYTLSPGRHILQLSASPAAEVTVMIAPGAVPPRG